MAAGLVVAPATPASSIAAATSGTKCNDSSSPDELRGRFVEDAPDGYLFMRKATHSRGVS